MDRFSKETRSRIMSKIRGKDTAPEILLRKELFRRGYRYSLRRRFPEHNFRPDIVMVSRKVCVFVDGCFWHRCPKCGKLPKSNKSYWYPKIKRNTERDREQDAFLKGKGWKSIRVWEHELNEDFGKTIEEIISSIES